MSRDWSLIAEFEKRVIDRFTPAEFVEFLDIPIEELVDILWDSHVEGNQSLMEEVGIGTD